MTHIDFHVNAPTKLAYACRLARKAYGAGARMVFYAADERVLATFDRLLWTFSPLDFIPHCRVCDALAPATPLHLAGVDDADRCLHHDVLVNLDAAPPAYFGRFERMIDLVGAEPDELEAGRVRWKAYKDLGYPLKRHDVAQAAASA